MGESSKYKGEDDLRCEAVKVLLSLHDRCKWRLDRGDSPLLDFLQLDFFEST